MKRRKTLVSVLIIMFLLVFSGCNKFKSVDNPEDSPNSSTLPVTTNTSNTYGAAF